MDLSIVPAAAVVSRSPVRPAQRWGPEVWDQQSPSLGPPAPTCCCAGKQRRRTQGPLVVEMVDWADVPVARRGQCASE